VEPPPAPVIHPRTLLLPLLKIPDLPLPSERKLWREHRVKRLLQGLLRRKICPKKNNSYDLGENQFDYFGDG
jgi:hypothetical protein